jgi:bifunctional non-homologous end joining protein LigD
VRRLASATEDHPLEYLDFEGTIPQGQYGGGTVMVWDIGTYEVIEGNYWKGRLHIGLAGKRLKGEWLLTKDPHKGGNAWLLEKAAEDIKPISAKKDDASALTGRSMAQIASANDAQWQMSNRSASQPSAASANRVTGDGIKLDALPTAPAGFVEPMECRLETKLPEGDDWEYEAKLDGYRAVVVKSGGRVAVLSRRNNKLTDQFPEIARGFEALDDETVVDGEIVALDEQGRPSFNRLQNRRLDRDTLLFYAFDLLVFRGKQVINEPLRRRRELLSLALSNAREPVRLSAPLHASADALIGAAREHNLEGIIAKRLDSRYEPGKRSGAWVKVKVSLDQELVIGGYIPAAKRHFDSLLVGYYDGPKLIFCGKVRNGFTEAGSKERVFERFKGLGSKQCPFDNLPEPANARRGMALTAEAMKLCCWLKPKLVPQVGIREWTADGHLRHSTFLGLREDKDPRSVQRET